METIIFKIVTREAIALEIPIEIMRKYPTKKHILFEATEKIIVYTFDPDPKLQQAEVKAKYIEYLKQKFKRQYNAYSVTVGSLQQQIEQ